MAKKKMTAEEKAMIEREKEWQARDDAYTLKRAAEIQMDKERVSRATQHVKKEFEAMNRVVGTIVGKQTAGDKPTRASSSSKQQPVAAKKQAPKTQASAPQKRGGKK